MGNNNVGCKYLVYVHTRLDDDDDDDDNIDNNKTEEILNKTEEILNVYNTFKWKKNKLISGDADF